MIHEKKNILENECELFYDLNSHQKFFHLRWTEMSRYHCVLLLQVATADSWHGLIDRHYHQWLFRINHRFIWRAEKAFRCRCRWGSSSAPMDTMREPL